MTDAASLPMYDFPEIREATDAFWRSLVGALARRGVEAPAALDRSAGAIENVWSDPGLLLSQTCGYPLMTAYHDALTVVGTPVHDAPGCEGAFHRAAIVVSAGSPTSALSDLLGGRCAVNDPASNTGMNLLRAAVAPLADGRAFFSGVQITGSHAVSLSRVGSGEADVAAVDAVTLALLQRHRPALAARVRVLAWTASSPGLPFVTSRRQPAEVVGAIRASLAEVATTPSLRAAREALLLKDIVTLPSEAYDRVLDVARDAADQGYPELR